MSFADQLKSRKVGLKPTKTIVTHADGRSYVQDGNTTIMLDKTHGFVVDTAPDNVPIEVIPGLFIGSQDCADSNVLSSHGINHVLSVGISLDIPDVQYRFVPCLDLPETPIAPVLSETNQFIKTTLKSNKRILVHCNAGVSRASMVIIGYLITEEGLTYDTAYNLVKTKRPCIQPNVGFVKQLKAVV